MENKLPTCERLKIEGSLGPIQADGEIELEIRPFTVFIGPQGTGKSLVSQVLYFFRNLPFLVRYYDAVLHGQNKVLQADHIIATVAWNNLRSRGQTMDTFAGPRTRVTYCPVNSTDEPVSVVMGPIPGRMLPSRPLLAQVKAVRDAGIPGARRGQAIYVPAERIFYTYTGQPSSWKLLSLPSTLTFFADAMWEASETLQKWSSAEPGTEEGRWIQNMGRRALRGEIYFQGGQWLWVFADKRQIALDMASSGQKANSPLILLAETLFDWRDEGVIDEPFYIHVEEPEIHLHPMAQVEVVKILAYLVNRGFRVVVTTHSLTVLYTLNNLLVASDLKDHTEPGLPEPEARLKRGIVGVYFLREDGQAEDIVDKETGLLAEEQLAAVDEALEVQLNRLEYLRAYGDQEGEDVPAG